MHCPKPLTFSAKVADLRRDWNAIVGQALLTEGQELKAMLAEDARYRRSKLAVPKANVVKLMRWKKTATASKELQPATLEQKLRDFLHAQGRKTDPNHSKSC